MPIYKYRVRKGVEGILEGNIEAQSEKDAIDKLSEMGYLPIRIEEASAQSKVGVTTQHYSTGRVKSREITVFSRELASLFKSGVPILNALNIIKEQSENASLRGILQEIHDAVKDGATFSSVISRFPKVFPPLYVAMVRTGENSGALPEVLFSIAEYRIKQEEMVSRFRMALAYPVLMAVVGLATVIFMFAFVIPRLTKIYVNSGQGLPLPTKVLIGLSDGLRQGWPVIVVVLAVAFFIFRQQAGTASGKKFWSVFTLHIPLLGKFILKAELARFCRTLSLLIKSGVTILSSISIAIPVLENEIIKSQISRSYGDLEQGGTFGKSLKNSKMVPLFMSNLISVGEESGKLQEALEEVAGSYERDTDETIRIMSSLLEPLMILVMGLIMGFIVVAMLLPIFDINAMVR